MGGKSRRGVCFQPLGCLVRLEFFNIADDVNGARFDVDPPEIIGVGAEKDLKWVEG